MSTSIPLLFADGDDDVESGNPKSDEEYRNSVFRATVNIRLGFLRKVYGLLSMQLLLTTVIGGVCVLQPDIRKFVHSNDWLVFVAFIMSIGILIALHFKRRETPTNFILLTAFTVVQAYTVAVVVTFYDQVVVLQALMLTTGVVTGLTVYTLQTKRDYSAMGSGIFAGLWILIIGGLLQMFIQNTVLELVLSLGGAFLFSLFIIFDTQQIMYQVSPEEYILATINLYLDIINLFLHILRALQATRR